ncbi:M1 family peptidase [Nocardioides sp. zg-579]|uniref:Aminopeptidase N n=1 Tax=Nocardioides marmotae TaxID=2663857 RepID=A0A6I3JBD7_9ACTN|nr:M1 family metallopeptidase [Nocardioides marmotae]MCR6031811.1 M1 family peptidase [Gordonia jinghuaiqii]MTB95452.1 M1 family peptidase [Nocardioides marmotae]QKE00891.1 M1 family metallopeptidase [Nocardioides marmotae]
MRPLRRLVPGLLAGTLVLAGSATALAGDEPAARPRPGSAGIGDPYFPQDGNGGIDVRSYDVDIAYDFDRGRLEGRTRLRVRAIHDLSRFNLDLLLPVQQVRVAGRPARWTRPDRHELSIRPARPVLAGDVVTVVVRYAGRPGRIRWQGEQNWLADPGEVVAMNQPHMAPWWFPANDHPRDKAHVDVSVTVPADKQVVGNGRLVSRRVHGRQATTRWRAAEPMAPYLAFFAAGRFQVDHGVHHGLPWYVAVSRRIPQPERSRAMDLMRRTSDVVRWTEQQLGPYPFSATGGLTTSLEPGFALENQTRPTYPVMSGRGALATVVHEVAHQWFGDSVAVRGWRDIWINEGAATFMEARYAEAHGGMKAQRWMEGTHALLADHDDFWAVPVDDPGAERIFSEPVYLRGGMAFQALRTRIGERNFRTLLRTWLADREGGHGSGAELEQLAAEVSGESLGGFFDAWLRAPRPPARTAANGFA